MKLSTLASCVALSLTVLTAGCVSTFKKTREITSRGPELSNRFQVASTKLTATDPTPGLEVVHKTAETESSSTGQVRSLTSVRPAPTLTIDKVVPVGEGFPVRATRSFSKSSSNPFVESQWPSTESVSSTHSGSDDRSVPFDLEFAKQTALINSAVVRSDAEFLSPISPNFVEVTTTRLDPEIANSGFLFGQRGVAAALSDFDWRWNNQIGIGQNELIQNNRFLSGGIAPGGTLKNRTGQYIYSLSKNLRRGGRIQFSHQWDYLGTNRQDSFYPSTFTGFMRAEVRQPLLAGAGRHVTDVAGPTTGAIDGVTGVTQGVLVARLQTAEAKASLELTVSQLLRDVEILYFQLASSNNIIALYEECLNKLSRARAAVQASIEAGAKGGEQDLIEIDQSIAAVELDRLTEVRNASTIAMRLRRLLGVAEDPQWQERCSELFLLPEPYPWVIDLHSTVDTAQRYRADFRILSIRETNLRNQLAAARNLNRLQLDFVSGYNINGFGDMLFAEGVPGPDRDTASAHENLFQNDHNGWDVRLELSSALHRRLARTRIRNLTTQLHRLRRIRNGRIEDLSTEIRQMTRDLDLIFQNYSARMNQCQSDQQRVRSLEAQQMADFQVENTLQWVGALVNQASHRAELSRTCAEYQNALTELSYRQGRMMIESGIGLVAADTAQ